MVDLTGLLDAGTVVAQRADAPVRIRGIRPGRNNNPNAGYRTARVAPAPALLRYRVPVPEHASLRFGASVEPLDSIDPMAPGVRFTVRVDERRVFSRVLNPQAHHHDRTSRTASRPSSSSSGTPSATGRRGRTR